MNPFNSPKKQLSIFITAGFPKIDSLNAQLDFLEKAGVDFVEVGIPFSDPLADGSVIQQTSAVALKNGMHLTLLFDQLSQRTSKIPIVMMGYLNPILVYGMEKFLHRCFELGIFSVILPDLSIEIYQREYQQTFERFGIAPVFMITPSSTNKRIQQSAELSKNSFVYLVSDNSTTGTQRNTLTTNRKRYQEIRALCGTTPLFIGFGIRTKSDVIEAQKSADGAIIGSAYLEAVMNGEAGSFLKSVVS